MPQVFVAGTWRDHGAQYFADQAHVLGASLAGAGFDLACGPGTGTARYVIDGFRDHPAGGQLKFYLPGRSHMAAAGESPSDEADEVIETDLDYPMRNVYQVSRSDGVFVLTGGDGTLEEVLPALIDYDLPVGVVAGSGAAAVAVERLVDLFPSWRRNLLLGPDVMTVLPHFLKRVAQSVRLKRRA